MPGGTFFFTLVTEGRTPILCEPLARKVLREAIVECRRVRPFVVDAFVLLPDHLHAVWTLPEGDTDYSTRWAAIKAAFTRGWLAGGGKERGRTEARASRGSRGVWQPRFWEHLIRDGDDLNAHIDYVHWNPVKHGYAACPHLYPYSSFRRWVEGGFYDETWRCACGGKIVVPPTFDGLDETAME